jgi:hypothetical protein
MDVEVKVLISDEHWAKLKEHIPMDVDDKKREVWFLDTPKLSLKQQEVVLRARINLKKKEAESTAKWRRWVSPFVPVRDAWEQLPGFKSEIDASLTDGVPAWSITEEDLEENLFRSVVAGEKRVLEFFNKQQQQLVESAWPLLPWNKLKALGPITSVKWEVSEGVVIERWTVGEESVIEVSKRGQYQDVVLGEIREWLIADGIKAEALEGGKTAWALARLVRSAPD